MEDTVKKTDIIDFIKFDDIAVQDFSLNLKPRVTIEKQTPSPAEPEEFLYGRVLCDYAPREPGELGLEETDIVKIFKNKSIKGKYYGSLNEETGYFPQHLIKIITEEEALAEEHTTESQQKSWYSKYFKSKELSKSMIMEKVSAISDDRPTTPVQEKTHSSISIVPKDKHHRDPGQRLLWVDYMGGMDKVSKLSLSKNEIKRQEVIYEIITTEYDYVQDLEYLCENYIRPLQKNKLIRQKDLAIIFSNIEQVLPVNQELLRALEQRQQDNKVINLVGEIIIRMSDYLKMYTMYCSNHPYAVMKLQSIRQNKTVCKFLDNVVQTTNSRNLDLANYLLKPIQRVCKYPLLVRELLKATEQSHPDNENLTKALLKIEAVVTTINEQARHTETVHKMLDLQSKFANRVNLVAPSRTLIKSGVIDAFNSANNLKPRNVYLFNDMFLVAKPDGDKLKLLHMIPLEKIKLQEVLKENQFYVDVMYDKRSSLMLSFPNMDALNHWTSEIKSAVTDFMTQKERIMKAVGINTKDVEDVDETTSSSNHNHSPTTPLPTHNRKSSVSTSSVLNSASSSTTNLQAASATPSKTLPTKMPSNSTLEQRQSTPSSPTRLKIEPSLKKSIEDHLSTTKKPETPTLLETPLPQLSSYEQKKTDPLPLYSHSRTATSQSSKLTTINRPVKTTKLLETKKIGTTRNDYQYHMQVEYINNQTGYVWKRFDDFYELHLMLLGHFPEEGGIKTNTVQVKRTLPELPPQMMFITESVAQARLKQLQVYVDVLLSLPAKISRSPEVLKFFRESK